MTPLRITYTQTVKITFPARLFDRKIVRTLENLRESNIINKCLVGLSGSEVTITFIKKEIHNE